MPLQIVRSDITKMKVDAVVNAAKNSLLGGGGVDGSIHRAAGPELLAECRTLGGCETGDAKITKGYRLPAKYVIHTVGPVWQGGTCGEREQLVSCYRRSLELAREADCETVAFPLISSGIYGYPKDQALRVAVDTIGEFLMEHDMTVYIVIFDRKAYEIGTKLYRDIEEYIDDHYVDAHPDRDFENRRRNELRESVAYGRLPEDLSKGQPVGGTKKAATPQRGTIPQKSASSQSDEAPQRGSILQEDTARQRGAIPRKSASPQFDAAPPRSSKPGKNRNRLFGIGGAKTDTMPPQPLSADTAGQSVPGAAPLPVAEAGSAMGTVPLSAEAGTVTDAVLPSSLDEAVHEIDESFSEMLLRKIDEEGLTDAQVYKKANIDRKLFSKIRSDRFYRPSKPTVLAFAIALELPLDETKEMLMKAGFALSHAYKFDIIIEYFIRHGNYNIFEINEALFAFDQSLLGV